MEEEWKKMGLSAIQSQLRLRAYRQIEIRHIRPDHELRSTYRMAVRPNRLTAVNSVHL
jgi:hypothetical protein